MLRRFDTHPMIKRSRLVSSGDFAGESADNLCLRLEESVPLSKVFKIMKDKSLSFNKIPHSNEPLHAYVTACLGIHRHAAIIVQRSQEYQGKMQTTQCDITILMSDLASNTAIHLCSKYNPLSYNHMIPFHPTKPM